MYVLDASVNTVCKDMFHSNIKCILYNKNSCDAIKGFKELSDGQYLVNIKQATGFYVDSVLMHQCCQFTIFAGSHYLNYLNLSKKI